MKKVLIICTTNSCRSQMAEGLVNHILGNTWRAYSCGIKSSHVNQRAIEVMDEIDIDISHQGSKSIADIDKSIMLDLIIPVCDGVAEQCASFQSNTPHIHLSFDDPAIYDDQSDETALPYFRTVRDDIRKRLIKLLIQL